MSNIMSAARRRAIPKVAPDGEWQPIEFKGDTYIAKGKYVVLRFGDDVRFHPWGGVIEATSSEKPSAWRYATAEEVVDRWWPYAWSAYSAIVRGFSIEQLRAAIHSRTGVNLSNADIAMAIAKADHPVWADIHG